MLVSDLLVTLTRVLFFLLAVITVVEFIRRPDRIRRDVALAFVSLAASSFITIILLLIGLQSPILTKIGQLALISQPFLLLRLVPYFRYVPKPVERLAIAGVVLSWIVLIFFPVPLSPLVTIPIILYFVGIDGYAGFAFIKGAFSSGGVTRQRLRFAAAGSSFLILVLFVAGLRLVFPTISPNITPFLQLLTIMSCVMYYLGFAPPGWLRQGWQFAELRNYLLEDTSQLGHDYSVEILNRLRLAVTRAIGTNRVIIALSDNDSRKLILQETAETAPLLNFDLNDAGMIRQAWEGKSKGAVFRAVDLKDKDALLMQTLKAETLFIIPIATKERVLGLLLVFLEYGSLFADDDLNLLTIFAQQTAIILENNIVLQRQRLISEDLERQVKRRTAELQRSNDELRQFAYVASHDLQEPLRMVASYLQLIEDRYADKLDQDAHEFIDFAVDGAMRMKALIEGLLAYSRVETRTQNFKKVDVQKVMDEVLKLLKVTIEESGATVTIDDPLPQIMADEPLIVQLFQNLIGNGIKYQKDRKAEIHVGAQKKGQDWQFSVKDNGIGIEAQYLDRIFLIFQRLHSRSEYPGTGIGLSVCKKVVEHHGGKIWVESEPGVGTTFFFTIPA